MTGRILIIDDEAGIRQSLQGLLEDEGYQVSTATSGEEGLAIFDQVDPDLIMLDMILGGIDGMEVISRFVEMDTRCPVIMMSGQATLENAVRATRLGAINFLEKPLLPEKVITEVANAIELSLLRKENESLKAAMDNRQVMVGESEVMQQLRERIRKVAPTSATTLILGESGTGKELVARAVHAHSERSNQPFVNVNCAAIPRELIESELFGYEKGAFTGAAGLHRGRFEQADGGSIFLDEVADTSLETQARLLRVLQEGEVQRLGSETVQHVDVRIIAATNKDLAELMSDGRFREDLFYRLNVLPLYVPPLRDRLSDLRALAMEFIGRFARFNRRLPIELTPTAIETLRASDWPGNVRELRNTIERLMILHEGEEVGSAEVESVLTGQPGPATGTMEPGNGRSLREIVDEYEAMLLERELRKADGVVSRVADRLNTDRANLYRKLKRYGLK
ncbi:sigma-54-dependent transcriptional regulator [Gemmatimonadota bacterium]